jgi:hypothetical protein
MSKTRRETDWIVSGPDQPPLRGDGHAAGDPLCLPGRPRLGEIPVQSGARLSAWERWTWAHCREPILGLKNRLGYDERLWVLGFELLDDGRLRDPFQGVEVFDPQTGGPATLIPARYSAVPEMYCLLSTYAQASETPLTGHPLSLTALDPVMRAELPAGDCMVLLRYTGQDWEGLQAAGVPFFGEKLARGDLAFAVWPLPKLPITLTLWRGDGEVPDGGTLLFDRAALQYLPGLLAELAWLTVWRLRNILDPEERWGYHRGGGTP